MLPAQLHIGHEPAPWSRPETNGYTSAFRKPRGVLWTSTWETAFTTGWPGWLATNDYPLGFPHDEDERELRGWLLEPDEANVFTVATGDDLLELHRLFGDRQEPSPPPPDYIEYGIEIEMWRQMEMFVDWNRAARELDAVRLLRPYNPDVRLSPIGTFYGWDCESTAWFHWRFKTVTEIPAAELRAKFDAAREVEPYPEDGRTRSDYEAFGG